MRIRRERLPRLGGGQTIDDGFEEWLADVGDVLHRVGVNAGPKQVHDQDAGPIREEARLIIGDDDAHLPHWDEDHLALLIQPGPEAGGGRFAICVLLLRYLLINIKY